MISVLCVADDANGCCNEAGEPVPSQVEYDSQLAEGGRYVSACLFNCRIIDRMCSIALLPLTSSSPVLEPTWEQLLL